MSIKRLAVRADTGLLEREIGAFVERRARRGQRKPLANSSYSQYKNNLRLFVEWCAVQTPPITSSADMGPDTIGRYDAYLANRTKISQKNGQPTSKPMPRSNGTRTGGYLPSLSAARTSIRKSESSPPTRSRP